MPSIELGYLIKFIRLRKAMTRPELLAHAERDMEKVANFNILRLEHERHRSNPADLQPLMAALSVQMPEFLIPLLDNQPPAVFTWRSRLINALDEGDVHKASELLRKFDTLIGFDKGINRQFIVSHKARLLEQQGAPSHEIMPLIEEGMDITFPEYRKHKIMDALLIYEEPELLHTKARVLFMDGKLKEAISLLDNVQAGLSRLPMDDSERERQLLPVLLTMSNYQLADQNYIAAYETCLAGEKMSFLRKRGKHMPDFQYNRALCLLGQNKTEDCRRLLMAAYFGYNLAREGDKAEMVLTAAQERFGIALNTYGSDHLAHLPRPAIPYDRGETVDCTTIGELICVLRKKAGLTQAQLCQGICSVSNLAKIEKNMIAGNVYCMEALMQRLGLHMDYYFNTFLSGKDFDEKQMRDKVLDLVIRRKYADAETLLPALKKRKHFQKGIGLQFIKLVEVIVFGGVGGTDNPACLDMLREALQLTWPGFDERDPRFINSIPHQRITRNEISLIHQIAGYYTDTGNNAHAAKIYERLKDNMDLNIADERAKAVMYGAVIYGYSRPLIRTQQFDDALKVIEEGEILELRGRHLNNLPNYAVSKAIGLFSLGEKEKSIPYFAQSYYGFSLFVDFGYGGHMDIIRDHVKEHGITEF